MTTTTAVFAGLFVSCQAYRAHCHASCLCPCACTLSTPQRQLERGVLWPTQGTKFWEQPPRGAPMPVDVGAGKTGSLVQPRDSRSLDIVHFTAELAPIAKVSCGTAFLFPGARHKGEQVQLECQSPRHLLAAVHMYMLCAHLALLELSGCLHAWAVPATASGPVSARRPHTAAAHMHACMHACTPPFCLAHLPLTVSPRLLCLTQPPHARCAGPLLASWGSGRRHFHGLTRTSLAHACCVSAPSPCLV